MSEEEKKGHGCFFYGCMTVLVLIVLMAIGIGVMTWKVVSVAKAYTSPTPMTMPVVTLAPAQMAALDQKLAAFDEAMKNNKPATLTLTADEINAKLGSLKGFKELGIGANVTIQGDQIGGAMSIPIPDAMGKFGLKGRYLNGKTKLRVSLVAGRLLVFMDEMEVNGKPLPEQVMRELKSTNLAEDAMKDPDSAAAIAKFKSITVKNGTIVVEK